MTNIATIQTLPDRNFRGGFPVNPATLIAYADDGRYYESFAREYASVDDFRAEALRFFNKADHNAAF